jgi:hypothetical protein
MLEEEVSKTRRILLYTNKIIVVDARGASGGLCTLSSEHEVRLEHHIKNKHWILTKCFHLLSNTLCIVINVYMPLNPSEKLKCWRSLQNLKNTRIIEKCILVGDLNIIISSYEKRGGIFGPDPFWSNLEEPIADWDLLDIPPLCGSFTWSNMRAGLGHIAARLDNFLVHNSYIH